MIFVITKSKDSIKKWFYTNEVLKDWKTFFSFFSHKKVIEVFKSDTLTVQDFLKMDYLPIKYEEAK